MRQSVFLKLRVFRAFPINWDARYRLPKIVQGVRFNTNGVRRWEGKNSKKFVLQMRKCTSFESYA